MSHRRSNTADGCSDRNEVDVIDKRALRVIGRWPIVSAKLNLTMALDESDHRLFVVTRAPTKMFVLDTDNDRTVATINMPDINDGVYFDPARKRLYVPGAVGQIDVYQVVDPYHYREVARVPSAPGAESELFDSGLDELFVSVSPQYNRPPAGAVLWYRVEPAVVTGSN